MQQRTIILPLQVKILVAGGCEEWCVKHPAMKRTEIFDLATNTWSKAADLPVPLNSHKLENLGGLPTTVGGYDTDSMQRNGRLYQYHYQTNEWLEPEDPNHQMLIPRSSAAVFQVPKDISVYCQ